MLGYSNNKFILFMTHTYIYIYIWVRITFTTFYCPEEPVRAGEMHRH